MRTELAAVLQPLLTRRSSPVLHAPGPTDAELEALLHAAATVPDHGALRPWRFVVVAGDARTAFGEALAAAAAEHEPDVSPAVLDRIRSKAFLAPALIAVAARVTVGKVPEWEQVASASCAGYAITLAAHQLGLGAIWKSSPFHDGAALRATLDLAPADRFLGWVNVGSVSAEREVVARPASDLGLIARRLSPDGTPEPFRGAG
ncbi:MAG: nitroreductase [Ilumatobacteraceae bacterium]